MTCCFKMGEFTSAVLSLSFLAFLCAHRHRDYRSSEALRPDCHPTLCQNRLIEAHSECHQTLALPQYPVSVSAETGVV